MEALANAKLMAAFSDHEVAMASVYIKKQMIIKLAYEIINSLNKGGTLYLCGNGGSAADSQHLAAEFVGRFRRDRGPLRAVALTTDTSILTAVGNDFSFDKIFERQVEAFCGPHDVLLCISTSGDSPNVIYAARKATEKGCKVLAITGKTGGELARTVDYNITVESKDTARIQEGHIFVGHCLCQLVEELS